MTLGEYVEAMITEYYDWKDGKIMTGEMRTLAAQIPAELFDRLDRYLKERGIKKKDFLVDIITRALEAAEALDATVVNMRWAKPLDVELLLEVAVRHHALVTLEEGATMGGAGSAVMEALAAAQVTMPVLQLGLPDVFIEHGDPARLLALQGLDADGIRLAISARFGS